MAKKIPMRQCVGCGEMKNKKEMMRVLKTPEETMRNMGRIASPGMEKTEEVIVQIMQEK